MEIVGRVAKYYRMHAFCSIVESVPKNRVFEIVGTVAKYYFDGMLSVQLFKR